ALGLAVAIGWRAPITTALTVIAIFALFHGYAHGAELPQAASPIAFALGFVAATIALHLSGIAMGLTLRLQQKPALLRTTGALIAGAGAWIMVGALGFAG